MRGKRILYVLAAVQAIMLCLWIHIALFVGEVYKGLRPVLEVGQKGVTENMGLSLLVLDTLKTKRYSRLEGYMTPQCRQEFDRFIQDWEHVVHIFGEMRKVEQSNVVLMHRSEQSDSSIISKWKYRIKMERGVAIVHCTLIYKQGNWQIDMLAVYPESGVPAEPQ
ncbi:MAG: hypothetical protein RMI45_08980 [Ignisphaera sp.]|nr:hypothetical protein [Ignisphaera sp.]